MNIIQGLLSAEKHQEGAELLEGLKVAELKAVASELDIFSRGLKKAELKQRIIDATVGAKLRSQGIRGY